MTFIEGLKKIKQNDEILFDTQFDLQLQIPPVRELDPENAEIADRAFERIDQIAEQYLPRSEECIIKSIQGHRQLPENPKNSQATNYLQQLERKGLLNGEILGNALKMAARLGHLECLDAIIHSNRFADISAEDLGKASMNAAVFDHFDCQDAIIYSNRSDDIIQQI